MSFQDYAARVIQQWWRRAMTGGGLGGRRAARRPVSLEQGGGLGEGGGYWGQRATRILMNLGQLAGLASYKNMIISCVANYIIIMYTFQIFAPTIHCRRKRS